MIVLSHLVTVVPGKLQQMNYIHTNRYIYTLYLYTSPYHTTAVYTCSVPSSSGSQQPLRPMRIQSHRRHSLPDLESRETGRVPNSRHRRPSSTFLLLTTIVTYRTQTLPGPVRSSWKPPRLPVSQRGGRGRPSQNAASGCRFPNRRIQRSVALSETCTRHAPPSYSFPSVITLGFDSRVGNLLSRSCRARRRCRKQGGTPRRDPALAWATRGTGATWPLLPLRSPDVSRT